MQARVQSARRHEGFLPIGQTQERVAPNTSSSKPTPPPPLLLLEGVLHARPCAGLTSVRLRPLCFSSWTHIVTSGTKHEAGDLAASAVLCATIRTAAQAHAPEPTMTTCRHRHPRVEVRRCGMGHAVHGGMARAHSCVRGRGASMPCHTNLGCCWAHHPQLLPSTARLSAVGHSILECCQALRT